MTRTSVTDHPGERHAWFTEQQTGHRWCHLCGIHDPRSEDTASREALTPEAERTLRRDIERGGPVTPGDVILLLNTLDAERAAALSTPPPSLDEFTSPTGQSITPALVRKAKAAAFPSDPRESLRTTLALSVDDWSATRAMAWVWGIVEGWDDEAMAELAAEFRWDEATTARLNRLHERLAALSTPPRLDVERAALNQLRALRITGDEIDAAIEELGPTGDRAEAYVKVAAGATAAALRMLALKGASDADLRAALEGAPHE